MELREFRPSLPSTQTEAVHRARLGAPDGFRVVAARQSEGRGRAAHAWSSPPGNVYLSQVVRAPAQRRSLLPLAVGARLRRSLADRYRVASVLKWPNDLLALVGGRPRKLAGVLVDTVASPTLGEAAVVGVGVNVRAATEEYPPELRGRVVHLDELTSDRPPLDEVEAVTVEAVNSAARAVATADGANEVLADVRSGLHGLGRSAVVDDDLRGIIRTVDDEGALWLDTPTGAVAIRSGDVVVEEST